MRNKLTVVSLRSQLFDAIFAFAEGPGVSVEAELEVEGEERPDGGEPVAPGILVDIWSSKYYKSAGPSRRYLWNNS